MRRFGTEELNGEVYVWCVKLAAHKKVVERTLSKLLPCERERAASFRFEHLRDAFVLSRGILRSLLSCYLSLSPERIEFIYGKNNKPSLLYPDSPVRFNLSHSGGMAVYAFTSGCEVGIDVEQVRAIDQIERIAQQFFCREETGDLMRLEVAHQIRGFFNCWVRKEAYVKALGGGLSVPLDSFRVSLQPDQPAALLHVRGDYAEGRSWVMHDFYPAPDYVGAVTFKDRSRTVRIQPNATAAAILDSDFAETQAEGDCI